MAPNVRCYYMPVRFRLAAILKSLGISQRELARTSGVSLTIISRMVHNHARQVSLATLDKVAKALGVEPGELIVREPRRRK